MKNEVQNISLSEAFKELEILNEDTFEINDEGIEELNTFEDENNSIEKELASVIDLEAEEEEDLESSYIGKGIIECSICNSLIYKNPEDIVIDEEQGLANIGEVCPICDSSDGYRVIGMVKPYSEEEISVEGDAKVTVDGEEINNEEEIPASEEDIDLDKEDITIDDEEDIDFDKEDKKKKKVEERLKRTRQKRLQESKRQNEALKTKKGAKKLNSIKKLKESVSNDAYEIADIIETAISGQKTVTMDEFDEQFALACRKVLGVDNIWSTDNNSSEIEDVNELESDVRGILSFQGWDTNLEDGSLTQLNESLNNVQIETDEERITVSSEPKNDLGDAEMIAPIDNEMESQISIENEESEKPEEIEDFSEEELTDEEIPEGGEEMDIDIDEFDEEKFDKLGEQYLRRVYENVKGYKTTSGTVSPKQLKLEGIITFKSGKKAKTNFVFESKSVASDGTLKLIGENKQFARGNKAYTLTGRTQGKKLVIESLSYSYTGKDGKTGVSKRIRGTVRR